MADWGSTILDESRLLEKTYHLSPARGDGGGGDPSDAGLEPEGLDGGSTSWQDEFLMLESTLLSTIAPGTPTPLPSPTIAARVARFSRRRRRR